MVRSGTIRQAEFTGRTVEGAVELGLRTLGLAADEVEITVVGMEQRMLGLFGSKAVVRIAYDEEQWRRKRQEARTEAYLTLRYAPDGFTLKVEPVPEALQTGLLEAATRFLVKHHVPVFRKSVVERLVEEQSGERFVVFTPEVIELDGARASIYLSPSDMEAHYIQYDRARIRRETLKEALAGAGIVRGVLDGALEAIVTGGTTTGLPITIARGKPPRHEVAPPLHYQFDPDTIRISFEEDASVNFRDVMRLGFVTKDEVLVRKGEGRRGEAGWTVTGRERGYGVEPEKALPKGANTAVSDDHRELRAAIDGHIEIHDGLVCVAEAFVVEGDVDYHTGNISFDGSVIVGGDVMPEFEIEAGGSVEVFGSVDDAVIVTGGDLVVRHGITGKGRGRITAAGEVKARHFENVTVEARRIHVVSSAVNCRFNARDAVAVTGIPGALVGGVTRAGRSVFANLIGSELGTRTEIVVGDPSELDAEIERMARLIGDMKRRDAELMKQYERAGVGGGGRSPEAGDGPVSEGVPEEAQRIGREVPELRARIAEMKEARRRLAAAKCHVFSHLYDGTCVRVFTATRVFTETVNHGTLLFDKDGVGVFPFQDEDVADGEDGDSRPLLASSVTGDEAGAEALAAGHRVEPERVARKNR